MSDTSILDAVKAFLKPIIAEAIQEAGNNADTETVAMPAADLAPSDAATAAEQTPAKPSAKDVSDAERDEMMSKYYTVDDVKAILHIGTTSVYNLFKRKKLTKMKCLGKTVVLRTELDNAVEAQDVYRYSHKK